MEDFEKCDIPEQHICVFQESYIISQCYIKTDPGTTDYFKVEEDSSKVTLHHLFLLCTMDYLMKTVMNPLISQEKKLVDLDFPDGFALLTIVTDYVLANKCNKMQ